jgi:filamentous hemagglutinin
MLAICLALVLTLQPVLVQAQQVSPDHNAPSANQPGVGAAPNGVPLIDIATPNNQGLSHNKYSDFNVGTPGLILNNYNGEVGTSNLGGVVPGNPNLHNSGPAGIILNEVTSGNRSALNGPTEVFGDRADVIIANPNGITCDGCGFINTPHATLTTGVPDVGADGRLSGYTVEGGDVTFGAGGGNFASGAGAVDLFDVVSRTININGPVFGKDLRLTAGANKFDYTSGTATALEGTTGTPEYAIDGSALGAMQADRIRMVVTEKGAGVRMRADMAANAGELSLSADGRISLGNASGTQGVTVSSHAGITAGKIASKSRVAIKADSGVTLQSIAADGDITLDGGTGLLSLSSDTSSLGNIAVSGHGVTAGAVTAGGSLDIVDSSADGIVIGDAIASGSNLTLTSSSGAIAGGSLISANTISLTAGLDIALSGNATAGGDINLTGRGVSAQTVNAGVDIAATSASSTGDAIFSNAGRLSISAAASVTATSLASAGDLDVVASQIQAETIVGHGKVSLSGSADISGRTLGGSDVSISGADVQLGDVAAGVDFSATSGSSSGTVILSDTGALSLTATAGSIDAGTLLSAGDISATASDDINAGAVTHGSLTLSAGGAITLSGQSLAASDVSLRAQQLNIDSLVSGVDFDATNASSSGNVVVATSGDLSLTATLGSIAADSLLSAGDLTAHATQDIGYSSLQSNGNVELNADQGIISLNKNTRAGGDIAVAEKSADLSGGRSAISTAGTLSITATNANFAGSTLTFGGLDISAAGTVDVSNATLNAISNSGGSGDLTISAAALASNTSTNLLAANDLDITLATLSNAGQLAAGNDLTINVSGNLTNSATGLLYAGHDANVFVLGDLLNDQGAILASHDLTIAGSAGGARNGSVTNRAGLLQAGNDVSIVTANLTNERLTTPTITNALVSSGVVSGFALNPAAAGLPYAYMESADQNMFQLYAGIDPPQFSDYQPLLWSVATLADGTSYHAWTWVSGNGPTEVRPIFDWIKDRVPKDANGNPILDPNNPSQYFIVDQVMLGGISDTSTTYTFDGGANLSQSVYEDRFTSPLTAQGVVHAGGNLSVDATTLTNSYSAIEADGNVTLKGSVLNNQGITLTRTTTTTCHADGACEGYDASGNRDPSKDIANGSTIISKTESIGGASATIKAGGAVNISGFATVNNTAAAGSIAGATGVAPSTSHSDPTSTLAQLTAGGALFSMNSAAAGISGPALQLAIANSTPKPQSGGFGGTVPGQTFLFETRPQYLDVSQFYGSSYFINQIGYQPDTQNPFLGDAYFENQYIDQQLKQTTGEGLGTSSFIPGSDAVEQAKTLLDNGVQYAKDHGLTVGQALTPDEVASLTEPLVWYQTETVDGVSVLAPVVYIPNSDLAQLTASGALISGSSVKVDGGAVNNSGAMVADNDLSVSGASISTNGGSFKAGGDVALASSGTITLAAQSLDLGGETVVNPNAAVSAGGNASLTAASDVTLKGTAINAGGDLAVTGQNVTLDTVKVADGSQQNATGAQLSSGGALSITATDNVTVIGSSAKAGTTLDVTAANGSVNVVTTDLARQTDDGYSKTTSTDQQESQLSAGTNATIKASNDILVSGSSVEADGNVALQAGGSIDLTASQSQSATSFGKNTSVSTGHDGATVTAGGSVTASAGDDLNIIGSSVSADGTVGLSATNNVTIAQATNTETLDLQSSKKGGGLFGSKTTASSHLETETAAGSTINGGAGVTISSGANTAISASSIQAGNDQTKGNLNITAGGDLIVASAEDTSDRDDQKKKSGFLSKSSSSYQSYDEATIASLLGASGDIALNATNAAVIQGSKVSADGSLGIAGGNVAIIGAQEQHQLDDEQKKSGLFAGSGDGFFSLWGSEQNTGRQSETLNVGSALSAGSDVTITARNTDVNVIGSSVDAGQDISLSAARDVNVTPGAEASSSEDQTKRSGFGISFGSSGSGFSFGIGVGKASDTTTQGSNTNATSALSAGRDLTINAGRDANLQAAQVSADRDVAITAANDVNLLSAQDQTNYESVHEQFFAGVSVSVSSSLVTAAENVQSAASDLGDQSGLYAAAPAALAAINAYKALSSISKGQTALASASLTAGFTYQKSEEAASTSSPVLTTVRGGNTVTVEAQSGDIVGRGAQISAGYDASGNLIAADGSGGIVLSAGHAIDLESVQATTQNSSNDTGASASVGIGASVSASGATGGVGLTANAAGYNSKIGSQSITQVNSNIRGAGTVTLMSGGDTTLAGAVVSGSAVDTVVGGDLIIQSRQDVANYEEKTQDAALGLGPGNGGLAGSYNQGTINGEYANVAQQSGFIAGAGGYHVLVDGSVQLNGGIIASSADAAKNDLTANSIRYSNIENTSYASASSFGVTLLGGVPVPVTGQPAEQRDHGATLSTISPGDWVLFDQQQDLNGLNSDVSKASTSAKPFDIAKLEAQQRGAAALSELANASVGDLAQTLHWPDGSPESIALHAAVAGIVAQLSGENVGSAALAGGISEFTNSIVEAMVRSNPNLSDNQQQVIRQWAAGLVGAAIDGSVGASAALDAYRYNMMQHPENGNEFEQMLEGGGGDQYYGPVQGSGGGGGQPGPGAWATVNEGLSPAEAAYQQEVTGAPAGTVYNVPNPNTPSGVTSFDGYDPQTNTLVDAKLWNDWPIDKGFSIDSVVKQAQTQVQAADGANILWYVPSHQTAIAIQSIFASRQIEGIGIIVRPAGP